MDKYSIQYSYAYQLDEKLVHIDQVTEENRHEIFLCVGCNDILVPVLGKKKVRHFRHKPNVTCSSETYIHYLAKIYFYNVYKQALENKNPFNLMLEHWEICNFYKNFIDITCSYTKPKMKTYDLTRWFTEIKLEKRDAQFIPDLLLLNEKGEKIYIEIFVTHQSSTEKLNSDTRIIEISISKEEDLLFLNNCILSESEAVKLYNFNLIDKNNHCNGKCDLLFPYVFIVYKSGKCYLQTDQRLEDIIEIKKKSKYFQIYYDDLPESILFKKGIYDAIEKGVDVKNCLFCKHQTISENSFVYCSLLKRDCDNSNDAVGCQHFTRNLEIEF